MKNLIKIQVLKSSDIFSISILQKLEEVKHFSTNVLKPVM
jgi:hypothetical protein